MACAVPAGNIDCRFGRMREHREPAPETTPPVVPGVGSVPPPGPGTDGPGEEEGQETDPHPDTPDDFDEEIGGDRESVETVIEKD